MPPLSSPSALPGEPTTRSPLAHHISKDNSKASLGQPSLLAAGESNRDRFAPPGQTSGIDWHHVSPDGAPVPSMPIDPATLDSTREPPPLAIELSIEGMNCQSCARKAREALQTVPGVLDVHLTLESGQATIRANPSLLANAEPLMAAIRQAGFQAKAASPSRPQDPLAGWRFNVLLGASLTLPLMLGEWAFGWAHAPWFRWLSFCLALPVQILAGARFYRGAWRQLKARQTSMDTLVALGSTTAFTYSLVGLAARWPGHLYFMEAAAIITLISLGHWMEAMASTRATRALQSLLELAPARARRLDDQDQEHEVNASTLQPGDRFVVRPGDRVPSDGEVEAGCSHVEESMLTGESMPVQKTPGSLVYGGTQNTTGRLLVRASRTGADSALAHIIQAVQRAQSSRASIQRLADRVSNVFVPLVVLVAVATALVWALAYETASGWHQGLTPWLWPGELPATPLAAAFIQAAAVLIVACPCALGLATPAAIMVAANVASRRGILIRDGQVLERSGDVTAVLFDKTGTLTQGKPTLVATSDLRPPSESGRPLLTLAAQLARTSSHPLAQAIALAAGQTAPPAPPPHEEADAPSHEVPGQGIELRPPGRNPESTLRLGSLEWLAACGVHPPPPSASATSPTEGTSQVALAQGDRLLGLFHLRDPLKQGARQLIHHLQQQRIRVFLVSGDHPAVAAAIATEAGIASDHVFAGVRPEQKAQVVRDLQARGLVVAFVGDGINDAPALEQADLGVAVARASDVARESADLVLLRSDLEAIPEAISLARAALRTIRQNLFWAFFYNIAAIPLAAMGFLSPIVCALAMGVSDLIVIGNALRLYRWNRP